jgi:hypothetical protein
MKYGKTFEKYYYRDFDVMHCIGLLYFGVYFTLWVIEGQESYRLLSPGYGKPTFIVFCLCSLSAKPRRSKFPLPANS